MLAYKCDLGVSSRTTAAYLTGSSVSESLPSRGKNNSEVEQAFPNSIEGYLAICAQHGEQPDPNHRGNISAPSSTGNPSPRGHACRSGGPTPKPVNRETHRVHNKAKPSMSNGRRSRQVSPSHTFAKSITQAALARNVRRSDSHQYITQEDNADEDSRASRKTRQT